MRKRPFGSTSIHIVLILAVTSAASGCPGNIETPRPNQPTNPQSAASCPVLDPTVPREGCPGLRLNDVHLTCGGAGKLLISMFRTEDKADRIEATLPESSVITAAATPIHHVLCADGLTIRIGIKLGFVYTGDWGTEPGDPQAVCIWRSRIVFTQFETNDPIVGLNEVQWKLKESIHQQIDKNALKSLYGDKFVGRCARWRPLTQ